jgi:hypothetical protein
MNGFGEVVQRSEGTERHWVPSGGKAGKGVPVLLSI